MLEVVLYHTFKTSQEVDHNAGFHLPQFKKSDCIPVASPGQAEPKIIIQHRIQH